jgi:hypothetical protein
MNATSGDISVAEGYAVVTIVGGVNGAQLKGDFEPFGMFISAYEPLNQAQISRPNVHRDSLGKH